MSKQNIRRKTGYSPILKLLALGMILVMLCQLSVSITLPNQKFENKYLVNPSASSNPNSFISTWNTSITYSGSSSSNQIILPLVSGGQYNFNVSWGDNSSDIITSYNQAAVTHTYSSSGVYTVNITGTLTGWDFNNTGDCQKITEISQWGTMNLGNSGYYFAGCQNLNLTATDAPDLSGTTDLAYTFANCPQLGATGNMSEWNVSDVTNMSGMFEGATTFNQAIGNWNVSSVTDMSNMFNSSTKFVQAIGNWNVSSVTNMSCMFSGSHFHSDISSWDVSHVTDMSNMFYSAIRFNIAINNWNVSSVTNMANMFNNANRFVQSLDLWNVSSVTNMANMFYGDINFNGNIDNWNVSHVTDMRYMFYDTWYFNQSISNWNVSDVSDMEGMFYEASAFNQPLDNWSVSSVTDMRCMFDDASAFNQPLDNWTVSHVTDMAYMFYYASAFNQPLDNWNVSSVDEMAYMFEDASVFNQSIDNWNVSNVYDMTEMFYYASAFNQPLDNWNVSNVDLMSGMFEEAYAFNQPLDNWNVSIVQDMSLMFYDDYVFNQSIGNWDVSKVSNMDSMFYDDYVFNQPLDNWNVSNVGDMSQMFGADYAFNQPLGNWNVSNVQDMSYMFDSDYAFSTENYGLLLIGWSQLNVQSGIQFSAGYTTYPVVAATAHNILAQNDSWDISDGGLANASTPTLYPISTPSISGNVTLKWSSSINDSIYKIYRSNSNITTLTGATWIANVTDNSYNDTDLAAGTYYYAILATNGIINSSISNCESVIVILKPSEPTNLNATAEMNHISLIWDAPSSNGGSAMLHYKIYRSDSGNGTFTLIGNSTTTSFNNTNVVAGQTYYYKISAVNEAGQSIFSNIVNIKAIFAPSQPTNLNATTETNCILLTWETPAINGGSTIQYFDIYRTNSSTGQYSLIGNSTTTSFNDTNVTAGQTYYYEVSAVNSAGASSYSNAANTTFITSNNSPISPNSYLGWIIFGIVAGVVVAGGAVSYVYLQKNPDKRELLSEKLRPLNEKLGPMKEKTNDLIAKSKQKTNDVIKKLKQKIDEISSKGNKSREEPEI